MSLKIDEYLNSVGALASIAQQTGNSVQTSANTVQQDRDRYISSAGSTEEAIPCENYNDILKVMQSAKAEGNETATSSESSAGSGSAAGAASGGDGSESSSEDETTTEVVTINGVTYLQTTTVSNGVTTVQRTEIGG